MTIGNLDYYDGNIYTLTLKDANPTDTYEASLSFKLPASETLQLVSGDYPVSTGSGEMTLDAAKSSWTFIDKENFRPDQKYDQRRFTHRDKQREPQLHRNRYSPGSERHRTGNSH